MSDEMRRTHPEAQGAAMSDVQTQNERGEWVPAIPLPMFNLCFKTCRCGTFFWTLRGYRGHYALAHILGTP